MEIARPAGTVGVLRARTRRSPVTRTAEVGRSQGRLHRNLTGVVLKAHQPAAAEPGARCERQCRMREESCPIAAEVEIRLAQTGGRTRHRETSL